MLSLFFICSIQHFFFKLPISITSFIINTIFSIRCIISSDILSFGYFFFWVLFPRVFYFFEYYFRGYFIFFGIISADFLFSRVLFPRSFFTGYFYYGYFFLDPHTRLHEVLVLIIHRKPVITYRGSKKSKHATRVVRIRIDTVMRHKHNLNNWPKKKTWTSKLSKKKMFLLDYSVII